MLIIILYNHNTVWVCNCKQRKQKCKKKSGRKKLGKNLERVDIKVSWKSLQLQCVFTSCIWYLCIYMYRMRVSMLKLKYNWRDYFTKERHFGLWTQYTHNNMIAKVLSSTGKVHTYEVCVCGMCLYVLSILIQC